MFTPNFETWDLWRVIRLLAETVPGLSWAKLIARSVR